MSEKKRVKIGKINIHMTNKWFYSFIAIFIFILAGGAIFAVNAGTDPAGGHAIDELSPPSGCSGYLKYNSGNWECSSFESYWNENSGGISYGSDVGAARFCDESMNNCFSPGDVGFSGTTIGDKSCSDDEILKYDSGSSEWVCGTADIGDEIQFSDYEDDNSYCYGTAYSCSQLTCTDVTSSSCAQCTDQYGCSWSPVDTIHPTPQEDVGTQVGTDDIYECKEYGDGPDCSNMDWEGSCEDQDGPYGGCNWYEDIDYIDRGIKAEAYGKGVEIYPQTNSDKYCDEYGNNCVRTRPSSGIYDRGGDSGQVHDTQKVRDQSWCSCPDGYYVYKIKMSNYADHGIRPLCSCKRLPVTRN